MRCLPRLARPTARFSHCCLVLTPAPQAYLTCAFLWISSFSHARASPSPQSRSLVPSSRGNPWWIVQTAPSSASTHAWFVSPCNSRRLKQLELHALPPPISTRFSRAVIGCRRTVAWKTLFSFVGSPLDQPDGRLSAPDLNPPSAFPSHDLQLTSPWRTLDPAETKSTPPR